MVVMASSGLGALHLMERRDMRFILVNGRVPCAHPVCVMCEKPISPGYLREITTHLTYCNHDCYAEHCNSAIRLLESRIAVS
jgi:hypothetical protein